MTQRVFVKVMGFTDTERHALNTVFRLSEQRATVYLLWQHDAPEPARLALIDGQSYEAQLELESPSNADLKLIWVGAVARVEAWRVIERPISWPDVVESMDELFAPTDPLVELDVDCDSPDTLPPDTLPPDELPRKRALIASADLEVRLYLRAKLALAELPYADEAETGAHALELARTNDYAVALVDFELPDVNGWALLKELTQAQPAIAHVVVTKARASLGERLRGWFGGAAAFYDNPPHPGKLHDLLQKV